MAAAAAAFSQADIDVASQQLAQLRQTSPNILFVIARSKNKVRHNAEDTSTPRGPVMRAADRRPILTCRCCL